ncbi:hypothetical protein VIGAN_08344800 [Vigna angularis var. angularis]|uniref:Uncharacterized protein n=1 Tax=Vigna angularis var. angularis TaxID=157739 RepID=A0A0S3SUP4_PHAAN|nr:hypothetical protein VIGAN_08344800 [Vigna angularis var. angularis]
MHAPCDRGQKMIIKVLDIEASPSPQYANSTAPKPHSKSGVVELTPMRIMTKSTIFIMSTFFLQIYDRDFATTSPPPLRASPMPLLPPLQDALAATRHHLIATSLRSRCGLAAFSLPPPALNDAASAVSPPPLSRRSSPSFASSPATSIDASSAVSPPPFLLLLCRVVRPRVVRFLPRHLNRRFLRCFSSSSVASFILAPFASSPATSIVASSAVSPRPLSRRSSPLFVMRRSSFATVDCRVCLSKFRD